MNGPLKSALRSCNSHTYMAWSEIKMTWLWAARRIGPPTTPKYQPRKALIFFASNAPKNLGSIMAKIIWPWWPLINLASSSPKNSASNGYQIFNTNGTQLIRLQAPQQIWPRPAQKTTLATSIHMNLASKGPKIFWLRAALRNWPRSAQENKTCHEQSAKLWPQMAQK